MLSIFSCAYWPSVYLLWASLVAQLIKNLPAMQETPVQFLGWEVPLKNRYIFSCSYFLLAFVVVIVVVVVELCECLYILEINP